MAVKKKPGTAVVLWQEQLSAAAKAQAASEKPNGGGFKSISTRGGILSVDDNPVDDNELRCIVLVAAHENQYYADKFNPGTTQIPSCFAFSEPDAAGDNMVPHEDSQEKQNETCEGCWANEMGSADTGRGKACKNIRRMLLVTEDALESADAMAEAEVRMLKVPVTSGNNWAKYVNKLATDFDRPTWGAITTIRCVQDAKTQFKLQFTFEGMVEFTQELFDAMTARREELTPEIVLPYRPVEEEEQQAPKGRNAQRGASLRGQGNNPARKAAKPAPAAKGAPKGGKPATTAKRGKF